MKVTEVFIAPTNMGDTLVSLLKNEEYPRKQEVAKGRQQIGYIYELGAILKILAQDNKMKSIPYTIHYKYEM